MNVLILSKSSIFRHGLADLIIREHQDVIVSTCDDLKLLKSTITESQIRYCFVDFTILSSMRWIDDLIKIIEHAGNTGFCLFSKKSMKSLTEPAYKTGVRGLIFEESHPACITDAVSTILGGRLYFPNKKDRNTEVQLAEKNQSLALTLRQKEVLNLLYDGQNNKQIGRFLDISESTVKQHFSKIFRLLNVKNRVEALQKARDLGVI